MHRGLPVFNKTRKGFTIAEVLVATVIIGIGMLALAGLMATVMGRHTRATIVQEMVALSESKLEELRASAIIKAADTAQISIGGNLETSTANHVDTIQAPGVGRRYYRRWVISAGPAGTKKAELRIAMTQTHARHRIAPMDFSTLLMVVR
jgi:prepilin-type N-terminal cleavage/methylation domain-containing protein